MQKMGKSANYDVANFKQSLNDGFNYLEFFSTIDTALYYSTRFLFISAYFYIHKSVERVFHCIEDLIDKATLVIISKALFL